MIRFFKLLIKNNTGVSMKNFILLLGAILVFISNIAFLILLYLDFFYINNNIKIDLYAYAATIGAIQSLLGLLLYLKVRSEKYENNDDNAPRETF